MPSFLSKVFGGKKEDEKREKRLSTNSSLLEGKFEAVPATVSPSAENFPIQSSEKESFTLGLLRTLSSSRADKDKPVNIAPHLSLNLPPSALKNLAPLDEVWPVLSEEEIQEKRLSMSQCVSLVKVCSAVISLHGLETPGIMHPHWHSSSLSAQRHLISTFLSSSDWQPEFEQHTNMHDIASVFRWSLRHLVFDQSFGNAQDWYTSFIAAERQKSYPDSAYSSLLPTLVPEHNMQLLKVTLDLFSSLAAHAERNATSASKLSKLLGLWILRDGSDRANWEEFYSRWERNGRILEHLFLASIRDEAATSNHRMPKRLLELVKGYPFNKSEADGGLLPRPRFSTRRFPALYIRILTELSSQPTSDDVSLVQGKSGKKKTKDKSAKVDAKPKQYQEAYDPLHILSDAFSASSTDEGAWSKIQSAFSDSKTLSSILADETLRLLTLASPVSQKVSEQQPSFTLFSSETEAHRPSFSVEYPVVKDTNGHSVQPSSSTSTTGKVGGAGTTIAIDWAQFSTSGFLDSPSGDSLAGTLLDADVEVTSSSVTPSRKNSKKGGSGKTGRKSLDVLPPLPSSPSVVKENNDERRSVTQSVKEIEVDESFIDFFADSLLDRSTLSMLPTFVVAKLKGELAERSGLEWVVVEQMFGELGKMEAIVAAEGTPVNDVSGNVVETTASKTTGKSPLPKRESYKEPGVVSKVNEEQPAKKDRERSSLLASTKKRFTIFSSASVKKDTSTNTSSSQQKGTKVKVGEMGEILAEEPQESGDIKETKEVNKERGIPAVPPSSNGIPTVSAPNTSASETVLPEGIDKSTAMEPVDVPVKDVEVMDGVPISLPSEAEQEAVAPLFTHQTESAIAPTGDEVPSEQVASTSAVVIDNSEIDISKQEVKQELSNVSVPEAGAIPIPPKTEEAQDVIHRTEDEQLQAREAVEDPAPSTEAQHIDDASAPELTANPGTAQSLLPEIAPPVAEAPESHILTDLDSTGDSIPQVDVQPEASVDVAPSLPSTEGVPTDPESTLENPVPADLQVPLEQPQPHAKQDEVSQPQPEVPLAVIEPIRDPTPSEQEKAIDLGPVPVVEANPVSTAEGAIPIQETGMSSEQEQAPTRDDSTEPNLDTVTSTSSEETAAIPENLLLSGLTPGPEVALTASEPAPPTETSQE